MITWQNFPAQSGAAVTTWNFDSTNGTLTSKLYADGKGTTNAYTPGRRLRTRTWARGIVTTYHTNAAGQVFATTYSDGSTPNVTNYFDRLGRVTNIVTATESQFLTYSDSGRVLLETNAAGTLAKFSLTHGYDSLLRQTSLTVHSNTTTLYSPTYDYDSRSSRLTNAADGAYSATYDYLANSPLVSQVTFRSNSVTAMTTTKQYDYLNRLLRISSVPSADAAVSFDYLYNDANQRTRRTDPDDSYWLYEYDKLGQLTSGKHYWSDGTPVAGQQFEYAFDDIGNRTSTKEGGDATGAGLRSATYGANALNQYTNRTVPGAADILGIAHANAGVSVNSDANTYRKGEYFWKELSVNNGSAAVWQGVTNIAWLTGTTNTNTGSIFVPKTPEVFSHDADGNLTNDGRFFYTWDAENRLLKAESLSTSPTASKRKVEWTFDAKGRRIRQVTSDGSSGSYVVSEDLKFLYDGWSCQAELNATNNTVIRTYLWGLDLSGSTTGAGGVGGLLALSTLNSTPPSHFAAFDGNGNVVALVSPGGTKTATYEYDPFGHILRSSGPAASDSSYRFSTKRLDASTDFALYEYRSYSSLVGKWLTRDPIEEGGGLNLTAIVQNDCATHFDPLGLQGAGDAGFISGGGGTHCDPQTGRNVTNYTEHCAGNCVQIHEEKHVSDTAACCRLYAKCYDINPNNHQACDDAFANYINPNRDWFECRAYTAEVSCLRFLLRRLRLRCKPDPTCEFNIRATLLWHATPKKEEHCERARGKPTPICPFSSTGAIRQ